MKKKSSRRVFGFGFDGASNFTGSAFSNEDSKHCEDITITATQRYRHDIREAVREIYSQATT